LYSEAKETARPYKLLSDKLGGDTTTAMLKYIDQKAEQAVEANIKSMATKNDIAREKYDLTNLKFDIASQKGELKADTLTWMFIFWIGQVGARLWILFFFLKKLI